MRLKLDIGQVFLTHPKDDNFVSVYEETFTRDGSQIDLFAAIEVAGAAPQIIRANKADYEKLARTIVGALKRTYVSAPTASEETFEKALANINSSLARLGSKEKITWFGRLNAVLGAVTEKQLSISVVGNSVAYLYRGGETSLLSEGLSEDKPKPTKLFANYASGGLSLGDRVVLSNRELLNFLSLERLAGFLAAETLEDACEEIITALSDIKDRGFAAYVFEAASPDKPARAAAPALLPSRKRQSDFAHYLAIAQYVLGAGAGFLWRGILSAGKFIIHFFKVRPKKYLFIAITVLLAALLANVAWDYLRRNNRAVQENQAAAIAVIDEKLAQAESALLYNENSAVSLAAEIEQMLANLDENTAGREGLENRLNSLKNRVSREVRIDNPTVLTKFASVPTDLYRSQNGILGFNKNSGRLAFYDFRTGSNRQILQSANTGSLAAGGYLGTVSEFVFLNKNGSFQKLDPDTETLSEINSSEGAVSGDDLGRAKALAVLGENASARLYALDAANQQIWRLAVNESGIEAPAAWLKTAADFREARDLGVDGSVYVLYASAVEKYFNGTKQNLQLSAVTPPVKNLAGMFVTADTAAIYLIDPDNKRILLFDKQGRLQKQISSDRFRELSDIYVDEKTGLLYALAGSELLQINLK